MQRTPESPASRPVDFEDLVAAATAGQVPYPYQGRLAAEGLPDLLRVPTGAGKTLAAVLPWLFRRRYHPDQTVRVGTPRRLVLVLPQRTLVEQTVDVVNEWLGRLGERFGNTGVRVHVLMGGASTDDQEWKKYPAADAILVGTQDMVLSRLLLRGYGEPRAAWPVAFGLLHASTQFVFDEVQLMGPALPTSLQLEAARGTFRTAAPCRSMWMSATVDPVKLRTVDFAGPDPDRIVELGDADRVGQLQQRLNATRRIERGDVPDNPKSYPSAVAQLALARHVPGTRTIVLLNTVERATAVFDAIRKSAPAAEVVLLHSRFRPEDRKTNSDKATDEPTAHGTIVVTTQVLEAGIDVSSRVLITEVAPWSSVVQRAGRCNRAGEQTDAVLTWLPVPTGKNSAAPYVDEDLRTTAEALTALEGRPVTSTDLQDAQVVEKPQLHPVIRRRDLLDLMDTAPDLSGNDIDVGRWIRDADANTVSVAWRPLTNGVPDEADSAPRREELCPVPIGSLRDRVRQRSGSAAVYNQVAGEWKKAEASDVRPGGIVVLDAAKGGYTPEHGWSPTSNAPVTVVPGEAPADQPAGIGGDPLSEAQGRWVSLAEHLGDVEREVRAVLDEFGDLPGLTDAHRQAAAVAGLYHDLGKAHPTFVASLEAAARTQPAPTEGGPWAKSPSKARLHHRPRYFRHELVSALVLRHPGSALLDGIDEPDLVTYLVAAHHGKVRMSVRALPDEQGPKLVLGVGQDDEFPEVTLPDGRVVSAFRLDLSGLELGAGTNGQVSWQAMACSLRDSPDLGPFRLGFLEAIVRMADWRASGRYDAHDHGTEAPR